MNESGKENFKKGKYGKGKSKNGQVWTGDNVKKTQPEMKNMENDKSGKKNLTKDSSEQGKL